MKFKALILFIIFSLFLISCESKDKWINPYDSKADQSETAKICEKNQIECGKADIDYQGVTMEIDCGKCSNGYECRFNSCWDINECDDPALNDCPQHSDCHNLDMESDGQPYECICKENYSGNNCVPDSRKKDCTGLPANAEWNSVSSINQTWNGTEWQPSNSGSFNEASSSAECRYKCKPNYTWTGSACKADTKTANCTGHPENAQWNTESSIEQTWNGEEWVPSSKGSYNESKSSKECRFKCKNNFEWNGSECVGAKQTVSCSGLPQNAVWNTVSEIEQTWDGTKWLPTEKGTYNEEASESECRFKCNEHYDWSGSKCVAATQIYTCTGKPENAVWNTVSEYIQTWDGSDWIPAASNATYNTNASTSECRFKCDTNYNWNDSTKKCDAATQQAGCSAKPANSLWNDGGANGMFMQTWNGSAWIPASYDSIYSIAAGICTFTCDTNYNWNNSNKTCDAAKQEADCSPKPANSVWNNSGTEGRFIQTWNGSGWTPASYASTYSATSGICTFKCESDYHWENNQCGSNSRTDVACTGKPENASWNTAVRIDQTWNGSSWQPSSTAQYSEVASETECRFKCNEHYDWNSSNKTCDAATQKEDCSPKPENTVWNDSGANGKFTQTWNHGTWEPASYESIYSETAGICTFKCDDTHYWYNSECTSPCDHDPCEEVANSTHVCEATSWNDYTCECDDGYFWNGSECKKQITLGNICTGQTKCYNNTEEITCPTSETADFYGQDAQYAKAGYCYPQSFTVKTISGKNIVVDNNTGLEWQQTISEDTFTWYDAVSHCENLEYGGYSDWRLPTPQESLIIIDNSRYDLSIDSTYFPNMQRTLWTGKEIPGNTSQASYFSAYYGGIWRGNKTAEYNVICVRGNEFAQSTFTSKTINGNEIVTDSTNNLMWQKTYSSSTYTWNNALKYCQNLTYAGYSDWRLPNKNEATSLLNFEKNAPYSDFPDMPSSGFWSSSNYSGNNSAAWCAVFYDGQFAYTHGKSKSFKVRCVRSEKINDPCENNNNCVGVNHSTGVCVPDNAFEYSCECSSGYAWNGSECLPECSKTSGTPCADSTSRLTWSKKSTETMAWQDAKNYCTSYTEGGLTGWHLPNIDELRTIFIADRASSCQVSEVNNCLSWGSCWTCKTCTETGVISTTSDTTCLNSNWGTSYSDGRYSKFGDTDNWFWSSSISNDSSRWGINFSNASVGHNNSSYNGYIRCVR